MGNKASRTMRRRIWQKRSTKMAWMAVAAGLCSIGLTGCQSGPQGRGISPVGISSPGMASELQDPTGRSTDAASTAYVGRVSHGAVADRSIPSAPIAPVAYEDALTVPTSGSLETVYPVAAPHPVAHEACGCCGPRHDGVYRPILGRLCASHGPGSLTPEVGSACGPTGAQGDICQPLAAPVLMRDPQEYIFDGGDRWPKVVIQEGERVAGLQPEDTVAYYQADGGCILVEPACRAAIYAPRFAAVRRIDGPQQQDHRVAAQAALLPENASSLRERLPAPAMRQPLRAVAEDGVLPVEAYRDRNRGVPVDRVLPVVLIVDALLPFEDLQLIRTGKQIETDGPRLQRGALAAQAWASEEPLLVMVDQQQAIELDHLTQTATTTFAVEGEPWIRICKVASEAMAAPGDEVHFTIRIDNVGTKAARQVVVLDSLPPRLEWIEGSQQASIPVEFDTLENEAGSHTLRWRLKEDLPAGEGGILRFRCRVR
jgi:uncharacterized repeat protein (TIGR01451 family)